MRKLLAVMLIMSACVGLEAGHCKCKPHKPTKEQKHEKKEKHKEIKERLKDGLDKIKDKPKCCAFPVKTEPMVYEMMAYGAKIKRDSNGDRV